MVNFHGGADWFMAIYHRRIQVLIELACWDITGIRIGNGYLD